MKNWAETLNGYQVLFLGYQLWSILRTKPLDDLDMVITSPGLSIIQSWSPTFKKDEFQMEHLRERS